MITIGGQTFHLILEDDLDRAIAEAKAVLTILRTLKKLPPSKRHQTLVAAAAVKGIRI
jgi:hypothetical protein